MRKMLASGKAWCSVSFRELAEARSRPKGFSTMTRAFCVQPACWSCWTTAGNMLGGMAR